MVEFIKFMFRKKSEQKNQNSAEQKLLKVEDLFICFFVYKTGQSNIVRQSNISSIGISPFLIVKRSSLAYF